MVRHVERQRQAGAIVGVLGILAGITGLVAERWAAAREARDAALQAINAELSANAELLGAPAFSDDPNQPLRRTVYPRLYLSAVDAAVALQTQLPTGR